ncbi:unnamed protein product [Litomosoides sigmodontis]|uniref:C-type lectin domain-containing protein n=1 Tax=Litomosoides sigmodontis TaxID=42156 RepID=A0A3P6SNU4_LITSI|nr:unnamed protein product [Litomosoides sigmodontis]
MEKTNSLVLMVLVASSTAWARLKFGCENLQSVVLNNTEFNHYACLINRKVLLTMKQSPNRILSVALIPAVDLYISDSYECKSNRDCMDTEICWNGHCSRRGSFGDSCLTNDQCSTGLMCSKVFKSKYGLCIFRIPLYPLPTKSNTEVGNEVIKIETILNGILTQGDEDDVMNETVLKFATNFIALILDKINVTDLTSSAIGTNGEITAEFPKDTNSRMTGKVPFTTETPPPSPLPTENNTSNSATPEVSPTKEISISSLLPTENNTSNSAKQEVSTATDIPAPSLFPAKNNLSNSVIPKAPSTTAIPAPSPLPTGNNTSKSVTPESSTTAIPAPSPLPTGNNTSKSVTPESSTTAIPAPSPLPTGNNTSKSVTPESSTTAIPAPSPLPTGNNTSKSVTPESSTTAIPAPSPLPTGNNTSKSVTPESSTTAIPALSPEINTANAIASEIPSTTGIPSSFLLTGITSDDKLPTSSSASEYNTDGAIILSSSSSLLATESSTLNRTINKFATTSSTLRALLKKNISEIGGSSKNHSNIANMNSLRTQLPNTSIVPGYLASQPQYECDNGWRIFRGRCYYVQMDKGGYTYHEAKKNCLDMGAVLVTIANKDLMEFLYSNFPLSHPFWIGLSKGEKGWKWPDGTKLRYQLWGKKVSEKTYSCAIAESKQKGGYWYTTDCNSTDFRSDMIGYISSWFCWLEVLQKLESRLYQDLLYDYNKIPRPVKNSTNVLIVNFGASLIRIIDVGEKNEILKANLWLEMQWNDSKSTRDPSKYGGITTLHIASYRIWTSDLVLAVGDQDITVFADALVAYDGNRQPFTNRFARSTERSSSRHSVLYISCCGPEKYVLIDIVPPTSSVMPLFGRYLITTMVLVSLSTVVSVITVNFRFRSGSAYRMSPWIRKFFLHFLPKILFMERNILKRKTKTSRNKLVGALSPARQGIQQNDSYSSTVPESRKNIFNKSPPSYPSYSHPRLNHKEQNVEELTFGKDFYYGGGNWTISDERIFVAMVLDRLFLITFSILNVGTFLILLEAPPLCPTKWPINSTKTTKPLGQRNYILSSTNHFK